MADLDVARLGMTRASRDCSELTPDKAVVATCEKVEG